MAYKDQYIQAVDLPDPKPVQFVGSSLNDLRDFPEDAKRESGFQIDRVQHGLDPSDWKPITSVGPQVKEIRVWDTEGTFRVIYLAKFPEAVYVLHCFKKTSEKTEKADIELARDRLKQVIGSREPQS